MKLRVRALTALAAAVAIVGLAPAAASAAAHPGPGAHHGRVASAPTAQLVFDDYLTTVNSIEIIGNNQNGQHSDSCWTTPLTVNVVPGWWWDGTTIVWPFTSNNCAPGTEVGSSPLNLTNSATNPPYHCLEDVSPFSDWNPGTNWQNCRIQGKTPFYGYATSQFVWKKAP